MNQSPAELVAIVVAAHKAHDRDLERAAKRSLLERFGIRVGFVGQGQTTPSARKQQRPEPEAAR